MSSIPPNRVELVPDFPAEGVEGIDCLDGEVVHTRLELGVQFELTGSRDDPVDSASIVR